MMFLLVFSETFSKSFAFIHSFSFIHALLTTFECNNM